ncbi:TolB family protein [Aspergillus undulatus]|uniref:TolB family protein n=1 Tax=Aspergillus undulatus TaxID=1810928 RepID=UPI003CCD4FEC
MDTRRKSHWSEGQPLLGPLHDSPTDPTRKPTALSRKATKRTPLGLAVIMSFASVTVVCLLSYALVHTVGPQSTESLGNSNRTFPSPPDPEPIEVIEVPLPPVAPNNDEGSCTKYLNPRGTGCISIDSNLQGGSFLPDGNHVLATVNFTGALKAPNPASVYSGMQLIIVKTDGTTFSNGDPWKCITCGVPESQKVGITGSMDYPQSFNDGRRAMVGKSIVDCGEALLVSDECTPDRAHIYPIWWEGGSIRELRLHPDNVHLGFNSFTYENSKLGQYAYFGRLRFNPSPTEGEQELRATRYEIVNVTRLFDPNAPAPIEVNGDEMLINPDAITVGELRGFSGGGSEVTYIGYPAESCNWDIFAADLTTGKVRRITQHPEYVDPIDISPDDQWAVILDTRGTNRQMWLSGTRGIPPITDMITAAITSATRNNGARRFFQPWLIDRHGDRGSYFGQQINTAGDGRPGAINDPNWNARADPRWSPDGTKIMYHQSLVQAPACGGNNPLLCPVSTAPGGRVNRLMLATLTGREPLPPQPVTAAPEFIPWGVPYNPSEPLPVRQVPRPGSYTLKGEASGKAEVQMIGDNTSIRTIAVKYTNFSNDGVNTLVGTEHVTVTQLSVSASRADWYSDLISTGELESTKCTGPGGFHLEIDAMVNIFNATGTMTTTVDGVVFEQPANGT